MYNESIREPLIRHWNCGNVDTRARADRVQHILIFSPNFRVDNVSREARHIPILLKS